MKDGLGLVSTQTLFDFHPRPPILAPPLLSVHLPPAACVSLQLPEEVPLQTRGQHPVPTSDPGRLRDPVLLCGRVDALQPGHQLPAEGQPRGKLHPAVSAPPRAFSSAHGLGLLTGNSLGC